MTSTEPSLLAVLVDDLTAEGFCPSSGGRHFWQYPERCSSRR
jgi:hypothetical protein